MLPFRDRAGAGAALARLLRERDLHDVVVLGLPRGGVPVAAVVADALGAPLDVVVVRKLGVPAQPELAMGAVGEGGVVVLDERVLRRAGVDAAQLEQVLARERAEVDRRLGRLRPDRPRVPLDDRTAVVVDDGLATGATMRAALEGVRRRRPRALVVAVPVGAAATCRSLEREVDALVCPLTPHPFRAVGEAYADFAPTPDDDVRAALAGGEPGA